MVACDRCWLIMDSQEVFTTSMHFGKKVSIGKKRERMEGMDAPIYTTTRKLLLKHVGSEG